MYVNRFFFFRSNHGRYSMHSEIYESGPVRFRLAVYGGAFDPPHPGHLSVITRALEWADQVVVVPSYRHAHGKRMVDFDLRCRWLQRLIERLGSERVSCSAVERELGGEGGAVYSYDLLCALSERSGIARADIALVIGEDNQANVAGFYRGRELLDDFGLLVAEEQLGVHSSAIRAGLRNGQALPAAWCLPDIVAEFEVYRSPQ